MNTKTQKKATVIFGGARARHFFLFRTKVFHVEHFQPGDGVIRTAIIMKIFVKFSKTSEGKIRVMLSVSSAEDYPTPIVFDDVNDWPSNPDFVLMASRKSYIVNEVRSVEEADIWANDQLERLRLLLSKWRSINVPDEMRFTI